MDRPWSVLCVNAGSATLKCSRYRATAGEGPRPVDHSEVPAGPDALMSFLGRLDAPPDVVAHRVVHGGPDLTRHTVIDDGVLDQLRAAVPFAPLHLPAELAAIDDTAALSAEVVQVACLDTAFHTTMPEVARRLPLPARLAAEGVRRYGFHGLSCEYVVDRVGAPELGHAVIAHLGGGSSVTAVADGRSVDTSMGLTPAGGVVSATRTGDLDPGVIVHLLRRHHLDADEVETLVTREAGLLGLSGASRDMRELLDRRDTDAAAALAVDAYCLSVRKQVAALAAVLGRLDTVVFTAGIGEHAAAVRARICEGLGLLGLHLDGAANDRDDGVISASSSSVVVRVVPTDENLVMARHALRLTGR